MSDHHHHRIGLLGLTMASLGSMFGSGWLFGAWKAARLAGPAAILAWPIGFIAILLIAFAYAELGARFPATGGMVRYTEKSHGSFAGFLAGWANWVAIVSVIPIEAVSSVQYLHAWPFAWTQGLYNTTLHELTYSGLALSAVLIVLYFLLNYWSVKLFLRSMVTITFFKIGVPIITVVALLASALIQKQFSFNHTDFFPYGLNGVFTAIATAGIIFSYHGFQSAINLSGEAKNPRRDVPLSIFLSMSIAVVIYTTLQITFIGVIPESMVADNWSQIALSAPYVQLAMSLGLNWLVVVLYLDAFVSPSGTGITYTATTARMLYGMNKNGYMPNAFGDLHPLYRIPRKAMFFNLLISFAFLWVFRGWSALVGVISVSTIISYATGPVAAICLRRLDSHLKSPIRIKGLRTIAPIAFIVITLVLYWARWPLTGEVILIMLAGLPIYLYYQYKNHWRGFARQLRSGMWLFCYLVVIALISYIGDPAFGGLGILDPEESLLAIGFVATGFFVWGLLSSHIRKRNTDNR